MQQPEIGTIILIDIYLTILEGYFFWWILVPLFCEGYASQVLVLTLYKLLHDAVAMSSIG